MTERVALHLGSDIRDLYDTLRELPPETSIEGDGWDVWGEPVGTAGNDGSTLHVVVLSDPCHCDRLVADLAPRLVTMRGALAVAVETPPEDWGVADVGGRVWHRIERVDGSHLLVVEEVEPPAQSGVSAQSTAAAPPHPSHGPH